MEVVWGEIYVRHEAGMERSGGAGILTCETKPKCGTLGIGL